ncbi:hypothetical protein F4679DRAFT_586259 [Xylaria curta]|nr:hypothetical protein F4679DRAFT_586259 [Xylaria curta]
MSSSTEMASEPLPSDLSTSTINNTLINVPEPGNTYKIVEVGSKNAITLVRGRLTVMPDAGTRGGWQWECEDEWGWMGFREAVSGKFLAYDGDKFVVESRSCEKVVLRPRAAGGCSLYCLGKRNDIPRPIKISEKEGSTPELVTAESYKDAARWEFYKV